MTFIVNQDGTVFQKDLGPQTDKLARKIESFDPDQTWTKAYSSSWPSGRLGRALQDCFSTARRAKRAANGDCKKAFGLVSCTALNYFPNWWGIV